MHVHLRIHHWVLWWFYVGVVLGLVMVVNILMRDLTRTQERGILILGLLFWVLGGFVCHAFEGVRVVPPRGPDQQSTKEPIGEPEKEWHPASDFVFPGRHKHLLPPDK
jgi:hypothetical protein